MVGMDMCKMWEWNRGRGGGEVCPVEILRNWNVRSTRVLLYYVVFFLWRSHVVVYSLFSSSSSQPSRGYEIRYGFSLLRYQCYE